MHLPFFTLREQAGIFRVSVKVKRGRTECPFDVFPEERVQGFTVGEHCTHGNCSSGAKHEISENGKHRGKSFEHFSLIATQEIDVVGSICFRKMKNAHERLTLEIIMCPEGRFFALGRNNSAAK